MPLGTVVIGGGSGFIGRAITRKLSEVGYNCLTISRQPQLNAMTWNELSKEGLPSSTVAVLNVAGQNVLDKKRKWTPGFQQNVYASRIHTTKLLADEIIKMSKPPKVFGTISGVGYYKASETEFYTENSHGGDHDYFSELCSDWEAASILPNEVGVRRFIVRSGVVLGRNGGIIRELFWPFYLGLGGPIGSGKQSFSWIHIEDIAGIFAHGVQSNSVRGVLNGVAPELITYGEFAKAFGKALRRPAIIPVPEFAIELAFGSERAQMMTRGQKVVPKKTLETGYNFLYPDIYSACRECAHVFMIFD